MLLNDFYYIEDLQVDGPEIKAILSINAAHHIFEGHFPGQPVLPGVCMMQMVKDLVENVTGKKTSISVAHDLKFLAVIDPQKNSRISAELKYSLAPSGIITVMATLFKDELVHFKFKGQFEPC